MNADQVSSLTPRRLEQEIDSSPVRVSYVITTRNRCEYLKRTLTNVREFIGEEDELIIVDGGSTDGTAAVVYQNSDMVSVFVSEPDTSEGHALNKALFLARGRFIKPITDDDYFYPDAMRRLVTVAEAHPEIDFIHTGGESWGIINGESQFMCFSLRRDAIRSSSQLDIMSLDCGLGFLVRRRTLLKTGGISPGYASVDGDWHCKLIEAGCCVRYLDIDLYRWTAYPHSGTVAEDRLKLSYFMFALRLRQWDKFYGLDFPTAARITGIDKIPDGLAFQCAVYLASRIWHSKARILLRPLLLCAEFRRRALRTWRRLVRRERSNSKIEGNARSAAPFTGELF
jgi:glycosyltransferase involved in cell wall biosynthesis